MVAMMMQLAVALFATAVSAQAPNGQQHPEVHEAKQAPTGRRLRTSQAHGKSAPHKQPPAAHGAGKKKQLLKQPAHVSTEEAHDGSVAQKQPHAVHSDDSKPPFHKPQPSAEKAAEYKPSLAFIKTAKTGGSTFGGVLRRIADKHGVDHARSAYWLRDNFPGQTRHVSVWANHAIRQRLEARVEHWMVNPYYITAVRDPISRCMAAFYHFQVTRRAVDPNDEPAKLNYAAEHCQEYMLQTVRRNESQTPGMAFASYDFILVTERFDESLLAMRRDLLQRGFNISISDLLYLKAKESGKAGTDEHDKNLVMAVHRSFQDEPQTTRSQLFAMMGKSRDARLVDLANRRLDKFGISPAELAAFQDAVSTVQRKCQQWSGMDCLWNDNGCGQSCIDGVAARNKVWNAMWDSGEFSGQL